MDESHHDNDNDYNLTESDNVEESQENEEEENNNHGMKRITNEIVQEESQFYQDNNIQLNPNYPNYYPNDNNLNVNSTQPQDNKSPNNNYPQSSLKQPDQNIPSNQNPKLTQNSPSKFPNNNAPNPYPNPYPNQQYPNGQYPNQMYPNNFNPNNFISNNINPNTLDPNKTQGINYPFPSQNPNLNPNMIQQFPNYFKSPNNPKNPIYFNPQKQNPIMDNYPPYNPQNPRGINFGNKPNNRIRPKSAIGTKGARSPHIPYNYGYNTEYPQRPILNFGKPLTIINKQFRSRPKMKKRAPANILYGKGSKGRCFACDVNCGISISGNSPNNYDPYKASLKYPRKDNTFYDSEKYGYYQY